MIAIAPRSQARGSVGMTNFVGRRVEQLAPKTSEGDQGFDNSFRLTLENELGLLAARGILLSLGA